MSVGNRFAELVWDTMTAPGTVDRAELLAAASAYLDALNPQDQSLGTNICRRLAYAALDHCVFNTSIERLRDQRRAMALYDQAMQIDEQLQRLTVP